VLAVAAVACIGHDSCAVRQIRAGLGERLGAKELGHPAQQKDDSFHFEV